MSDPSSELTCDGLSVGMNLGRLHPDFPRDPTTERFQRTLQHAIANLNTGLRQLELVVLNFESTRESTLRVEAKKCSIQVNFFLKEVVGLRLEAGTTMVEGGQAVQDAELALSQLEGKLSSSWHHNWRHCYIHSSQT
jgi:SMC interacting uncharacterized protein involved in chromosome segregation